jgi:HAMP domain-containing protein
MLSLIPFLEEIEQSHHMVVLPAAEVERLVGRFGPLVRSMGVWNKTSNGSVEIPISNIAEAVKTLDNQALTDAVAQLKSDGQFAEVLSESSAAGRLIEALSSLQEKQFEQKVERYQVSADSSEVQRLRNEISRELFGP